MTQCWPEGALRACLDGELPAEEMARARAHLAQCPVCHGLYSELGARAARVTGLMETLPVGSGIGPVAVPRPARVPARRRNWVASALALAAGLALAFYLLPARRSPEARVVPTPGPAPAPPPPAAVVADVAPLPPAVAPAPPAPRPARHVRAAAPPPADFVALDNEPFESGVIMRVDVKPGNLQADIVFGPDGRARAFRVVNASQRNF